MKLSKTIFLILGALLLFGAFSARAEEQEVKASLSVSATVPSKACPQYSSVKSNVAELLSDASQKAVITVILKDCNKLALAGTPVLLTSNRGALDKIQNVDDKGVVITSGDGLGVAGTTDANGYLFFEVYSRVPGESIVTARADNLLDIGMVKLTFLPLPFPRNLIVVAEVPRIISPSGAITIFRPKNLDFDREKLVNLTMELRIPVWVFYLAITMAAVNFLMFLTIMILVFRIRKMQNKEITVLEEEKAALEKTEAEIEQLTANRNGY